MESRKKEMALAKMKHEERMNQERELLDQQVKFQKAVEASQNSTEHLQIGRRSGTNSRPKSTKRN